jgi:aminopeptidase YwaD
VRPVAARVALALALTSNALAQEAPARCEVTDAAVVARVTADVAYLASDALGGREPGTAGGVAAADHIIQRLTELGVEPAGTDGFRQPFEIEYGVESTAASAVLARVRGETRALTMGADFRVANEGTATGDGRAVGALVYVGHGLFTREAHWNDFGAGSLVRGRVAVALSGPPAPADSAARQRLTDAHIVGSLSGKARAARERGAVGLIEIELDPREPVETYIAPPTGGGIPTVRVSRAVGAWLLGVPEASLAAETAEVRPRRLEGASARVITSTRRRHITTANVLGVVRAGRDVDDHHRRRAILVGAHYDHIGRGGWGSLSPGVYGIYNGADDNASGTSAVLEVARRVAREPAAVDVVFAWFGAEEEGLVGSRYMVAHRPLSLANMTAMMNLDMVGRLRGCRLFVESRETAPAFGPLVDAANAGFGFDARPWEPSRGAWGASDHMSFTDARIPSVFLFTGLHDVYHRPADDAPTLNYPGLAAVASYAERLVRDIAERSTRDATGFVFTR